MKWMRVVAARHFRSLQVYLRKFLRADAGCIWAVIPKCLYHDFATQSVPTASNSRCLSRTHQIANAPSEASGSAPEKLTEAALFIRRWRTVGSPQESLLCALLAALLPGDPFANIRIAIHQRDARRFAPDQKIDAVLTCQSHIFQVESDAAALSFRADECFQLGDMLCVHPAAYRKNYVPVFRPVNSEHSALSRKTSTRRDAGPGPTES